MYSGLSGPTPFLSQENIKGYFCTSNYECDTDKEILSLDRTKAIVVGKKKAVKYDLHFFSFTSF